MLKGLRNRLLKIPTFITRHYIILNILTSLLYRVRTLTSHDTEESENSPESPHLGEIKCMRKQCVPGASPFFAHAGTRLMTQVQGESRITSHLHHIATSGIAQGVRHFFKAEKKRRNKTHFLALALTLTCILSPNHYTTSNFKGPCTLFRLMCTAQPSYKCHTTLRMRNARSTHTDHVRGHETT